MSARRDGCADIAVLTSGVMATDVVCVYYRRTHDIDADAVDAALALLSIEERARYDALAFAEDKRDYAVAHALLRVTLGACVRMPPQCLRFAAARGGKPTLLVESTMTAPSFSLSHARGLVTCAIATQGVVGVDVEPIDPMLDGCKLARRYFAADEAEALEACAQEERTSRFFELWTLKEALLKALGAGLGLPLDCVSFDPSRDGIGVIEHPPLRPREWTCATVDLGRTHKLAVAATPGRKRPVILSEC